MNNGKLKDISQIIIFQISLLIVGHLLMVILFYSIIPAIVIQSRLPESFFQSSVRLPEKQKMIEGWMNEYLQKPGSLEKEYFTLIANGSPAFLIWNNLFWVLAFILPSVWIFKKLNYPFNNFAEDQFSSKVTSLGLLIGIGTIIAVSSFERILFSLGIEIKGNDVHNLLLMNLQNNTNLFLWSVYSVGIFTGVIEETFFRGFLLTHFIKKEYPVTGLIFTSAIFGSIHYAPEGSILIPFILTFVGFVFGYSYYRTKNIWTAITAHITYNSILLLIAYTLGVHS